MSGSPDPLTSHAAGKATPSVCRFSQAIALSPGWHATVVSATATVERPPLWAASSARSAPSSKRSLPDRQRADRRRGGVLVMAPKPFAGEQTGGAPAPWVAAATLVVKSGLPRVAGHEASAGEQ